MKLTRNSLRQIILEQLSMVKRNHSGWQGWVSEDDEDDNEDTDLEENPDDRLEEASGSGLPPGSGRIWVAGRSISGPTDIGKHAWIMVKKPGDPSGPIISLSGKSGVGFEGGILKAALRKIIKGEARDRDLDKLVDEISQAYHKGQPLRQELLDMLEKTSWGPLRKKINYEADTIANATDLWEITPNNVDDAREAIKDVLSAYSNYTQMTPYDPMPGITSSNPAARNSNSFASTLLDVARSNGRERFMPRLSGLNVEQYPGWHLSVSTLKPSASTRRAGSSEKDDSSDGDSTQSQVSESLRKLTRRQLRKLINDELLQEVQQVSWNPMPNGGFEAVARTPRPVLQGRVCGPKSDEDAAEMFTSEKGIESGEYFVTCILASGTGKMGLAGIDPTPDSAPYPRQFAPPRGGRKCWTCVATKDSGAAEQALSWPDEEPPPGTESI